MLKLGKPTHQSPTCLHAYQTLTQVVQNQKSCQDIGLKIPLEISDPL